MTVARTPAAALAAGDDTLQRLAGLLETERGPLAADALVRFVVPAGELEPRAVLRVPSSECYLWESPEGESLGGLGCAALLRGSGEGRLEQVRAEAARVGSRLVAVHDRDLDPLPALFLGGAAFRREGALRARWAGFGDASFVLPRWLVRRPPSGPATLELTVGGAELAASARDGLLAEAARLLDAEAEATPAAGPGASSSSLEASWREPETVRRRWNAAVEHLLEAIRRGEIRKAVAARWLDVRLPFPASPPGEADRPAPGVVERVVDDFGRACHECVRFVVQRGSGAFVGSTPELLVRLRGRDLETHALAGTERNDSTGAGDPRCDVDGPAARRLLARDKDRREHQLVVEHIVDRLAPYCSELEAASVPRVKALRHLLHLETPIRARLAARRHILEMAAALHPTPAVAGVPVERSLELLSEVEAGERGWYAGPVGWFDERGDGALSVALRSMLVGRSSARLYAGAGIVADSEPAAELEETRWKLAGAWAALTAAAGAPPSIEGPAMAAPGAGPRDEHASRDAEPPAG